MSAFECDSMDKKASAPPLLFVGTGWYSNATPRDYKTYGDDLIRSPEFRSLWWTSLKRFIRPDTVIVIDSASPVKPVEEPCPGCVVKNIELTHNPGHSTTCLYHYSGWMASAIMSIEYAYACGADMYIYVEQDALLWGEGLRSYIISQLERTPYIFGNGTGTPQALQQSFFAIHRRGMRKFLRGLHAINKMDRDFSPETKFHLAAAPLYWTWFFITFYNVTDHKLFDIRFLRDVVSFFYSLMIRISRCYSIWPFGYGRVRPIDFKQDIFYFQHGMYEEIETYRNMLSRI